MATSIFHRASGIALATGLIVLMVWLMSIAGGPASYLAVQETLSSLFGRLMLIAWSLAFFYHLANGIRHLFWDAGYGFEKAQANRSAWAVIVAAVLLTAGLWLTVLT